MSLTNAYVLPTNRVPDVFARIRDGQAPDYLTTTLLKDWGFASSNDRAFIPLLKALGFLSADGKPTQRYHNYRDHSMSKVVMAEALKEAYGDIFLIKAKPSASDKKAVEGKFKSFHNVSDNVAQLMAKTFFALLAMSDLDHEPAAQPNQPTQVQKQPQEDDPEEAERRVVSRKGISGLHYNIQIHLPATKDIEVYNAIFKSLREHLIEN